MTTQLHVELLAAIVVTRCVSWKCARMFQIHATPLVLEQTNAAKVLVSLQTHAAQVVREKMNVVMALVSLRMHVAPLVLEVTIAAKVPASLQTHAARLVRARTFAATAHVPRQSAVEVVIHAVTAMTHAVAAMIRCCGSDNPCCAGGCDDSGVNGDPHMYTFDKLRYSCQGKGEFVLVKSIDSDVQVQGRFEQKSALVSLATGVAISGGVRNPDSSTLNSKRR